MPIRPDKFPIEKGGEYKTYVGIKRKNRKREYFCKYARVCRCGVKLDENLRCRACGA